MCVCVCVYACMCVDFEVDLTILQNSVITCHCHRLISKAAFSLRYISVITCLIRYYDLSEKYSFCFVIFMTFKVSLCYFSFIA